MRKLVGLFLAVTMLWSVALGSSARNESFTLAERVGEGNERSFFVFSTSAGNYIVRHDGMGEFTSPAGLRRVFMLKVGAKARIDRVYFLEHEHDLYLMYEVHDSSSRWAYVVRMEQAKRKAKWVVEVDATDLGAPAMQGEFLLIDKIEISKANGQVRQD